MRFVLRQPQSPPWASALLESRRCAERSGDPREPIGACASDDDADSWAIRQGRSCQRRLCARLETSCPLGEG